MRSRYSAYALGLSEYLIQTTHLKNPSRVADVVAWRKQLDQFSRDTTFEGLKILKFVDGKTDGTVKFTAFLMSNGKNASFTETSEFVKEGDRWFYLSGDVKK